MFPLKVLAEMRGKGQVRLRRVLLAEGGVNENKEFDNDHFSS